ncbi:MAG: hypothetical protein QNJ12_04475 [Ilumatobacter sp.]|uniref:hypothetical protein n=1 Tax=Ilumatobacter sp. TaxID=1967498 RepID=UPI002633DA4C|nr:hypothetical protein [Ilumatobacter sp.]MDJ0768021.1 hypothetical protein [Ilumatobacter sp.]
MRDRRSLPILATGVLLLGACTGDADRLQVVETTPTTAPQRSRAPSTTPSPTDSAPDRQVDLADPSSLPELLSEALLFASVDEFAGAFTAANEEIAELDSQRLALDAGDLVIAPLAGGGDGFVAADLFEAGFLGGTIDPDGSVSSVLAVFDPDDDTVGAVLVSLLVATQGTPGEFDLATFNSTYAPLALRADERGGEQASLAGAPESGYSLVVTVIEGEAAAGNLVEVAIVPLGIPAEAEVAVQFLRPELLAILPS